MANGSTFDHTIIQKTTVCFTSTDAPNIGEERGSQEQSEDVMWCAGLAGAEGLSSAMLASCGPATEKAVADTAQAEAPVGSRILKGRCWFCLKIPTTGNRMGGHYHPVFGGQASSNSGSSLGEGSHSLPPAWV